MSRFREGRHAEVQAGEGDLDQIWKMICAILVHTECLATQNH